MDVLLIIDGKEYTGEIAPQIAPPEYVRWGERVFGHVGKGQYHHDPGFPTPVLKITGVTESAGGA